MGGRSPKCQEDKKGNVDHTTKEEDADHRDVFHQSPVNHTHDSTSDGQWDEQEANLIGPKAT